MSELVLELDNQGIETVSAAPIIHFEGMEGNTVCIVSNRPTSDVKEEKEDKSDISSIIARSLQSVENGAFVEAEMVVEKQQGLQMGQAVVNCLQTINPDDADMDSLGIVIEEVHIVEEVEWHQEDLQLQRHEEQTIVFSQLCRICAMETEKLISVFGEEGKNLELAQKIHWHLPIEVKEDDKLPLSVCSSCICKLNSCHELATSCLEANEKLQKLFNIVGNAMNDSNLMSNFAAAHSQEVKEVNVVNTDPQVKEENTDTTEPQRSSRRSSIPSQQLTKAMALLKKAKQMPGRNTKLLNNGQQRSFVIPDMEYSPTARDDGDDVEDTNTANIPSEGDGSQNLEDSEPVDLLDICMKKSGYKRPQRQIKRKVPKDADSYFNYKIVERYIDIVKKEEDIDEVGEKKKSVRQREWTCVSCGDVFPKKSALIMHQQQSHCAQDFIGSDNDKTCGNVVIRTSFMCEYCGKAFRGKKTLKEHHLANHSDDKPYKCDKCDRNYGSLTSLDIHRATHSTETPYLCDLCGKSFKHVSNLRSHKRSHMDESNKNRQVCDVCGKGFRSRFHLSEHMNVHTGRRPYACNVCGKHFHKKIQLRQHGSAHSGTQPFKCHLCGVRFNRRGNMTQHIKRHDRERKYTCRVCNEGFTTLGGVLSHRKKHTKEEVENSIRQQSGFVDDSEQAAYKCEVCGKLLAKKESLTIHMRSHTGEKPFECGVCGKRLSNKGSLSYHMRSFHTGERPHTCQFCGEGFLSREACMVHERIHTGEKPYICSICGMGFRCSSNLAQHSRVHSEARPHPCPHCEKRFQRKGALDVHIRTHTGERPYGCDMCGRRFTQKNDMLKHRRTHSPTRLCACLQCGQTFTHKRELAKHQVLHITPAQVQTIEHSPPTQTVLIATADNLITYPEINIPVMENGQALILHSRY